MDRIAPSGAVGWVFTVEPKLFVTDQSFGIMIKDQVLVTEDGIENLSRSPRGRWKRSRRL